MTFLNPLVLFGLAAAAIPVLIHLFNFRRPQRIDFSTLRFLREIEATSVRRVRIQQWILLALRTLAVVCLVLAFARPTLPTADAGVFGDDGARAVAVVLDNSLSMTLRDAGGAYLDQAKALAGAAIEATGRGDQRTLVPTALGPGQRPLPYESAGPVLDAIEETRARSGSGTVVEAVARAASGLQNAVHPRREIVVVSDLQASTFGEALAAPLPDDVDLVLLPVGSGEVTNTAVTGARVASRIVEPGRPVRIEAEVTRFGGDAGRLGASLWLDGRRVSEASVDVAPGTPTRVQFQATPPARGALGGEVRIEPDEAEWDDVRALSVEVPPPPRVAIVRGGGARSDLVALALGLSAETGGVTLNEVAAEAFAGVDLDATDVVILVGTGGDAGRLGPFVQRGGGLVVFPGAEASLPGLAETLGAVGGGRFSGVEAAEPAWELTDADTEHPLFAGVFEDGDTSRRLEAVEAYRAARYQPGGGDEQTIVGLQSGAPFLHEIRSGQGRVLVVGVAPDPEWSDLTQRGLFVPLLYRAVAYLSAGAAAGAPEEEGLVRVEGASPDVPITLVGPDSVSTVPEQRVVPGGVLVDVRGGAERPGLYRVVQGERTLRVVAVNGDSAESDPTPLTAEDAAERLEAATGRPVRVLDAARVDAGAGGRSGPPLWTYLLGVALACLVAETLLTTRWRAASAGARA